MNKKILITFLFSFVSFLFVSSAESNSSGPNSPIVVGHIIAVNGQEIEVKTKKLVRQLVMNDKTKIIYVGITEQEARKMNVGYGFKGKATDGVLKSALLSLPVQAERSLSDEQVKLAPSKIFAQTDIDKDAFVSYVEFSSQIYYSPKHGPDKFVKADKDKDGLLNLKEFANRLAMVSKWTISRQSPEAWFKQADVNNNGELTLEEYREISQSKNHVENGFKKKDKDKSGLISLKEWLSQFQK
jgi:Ca2+-binding EF-hand superfamily protein